MKVQVFSIGSVWFGSQEIAINPWRGNEGGCYYTLAEVRKTASRLGFPRLAGEKEVERFGKEMLLAERRRKDAPVSKLLCFKHRSKISRSVSRAGANGRARSELVHVPYLGVNPHPWPAQPGVAKEASQHLCWSSHTVRKVSGEIYISPYDFIVFSK